MSSIKNFDKIEFIPEKEGIFWSTMLVFPDLETSNEAVERMIGKPIRMFHRWSDTIIQVEIWAESPKRAVSALKAILKGKL